MEQFLTRTPKRSRMKRSLFLAASGAFTAMGPAAATAQSQTVGQIIGSHPQFSKFAEWAKAADVQSRLSGGGPYTVFAPVNYAFGHLVPGLEATMLKPANKRRLLSVVLYHVIPGALDDAKFKSGTVKTMNGQLLTISSVNGVVLVNNYGIEHPIPASNGLVYPCGGVLVPPVTQGR
jgi:uncharacterized surface protein with fasciclin (FAS1) repeats